MRAGFGRRPRTAIRSGVGAGAHWDAGTSPRARRAVAATSRAGASTGAGGAAGGAGAGGSAITRVGGLFVAGGAGIGATTELGPSVMTRVGATMGAGVGGAGGGGGRGRRPP